MSTSRASCDGIVDYSFYVPKSETTDGLNEKARRLFSNQIFDLLPRPCRASVKKLVCTNIYRECKTLPTLVSADWEVAPILARQSSGTPVSHWGNSSLLPFKLPCSTICDEITDTCKGFFKYFDTGDPDLNHYFNCSAKLIARRSLSTTENITVITDLYPATGSFSGDEPCTDMSTVAVDVAESIEAYAGIGNAVCRGVVSHAFIPSSGPSAFPGSRSLNLLPMAGAFEVQTILEARIDELLKRLPIWISGACYASVRTLLCKSYMMSGQNQSFEKVFDKTVRSSSAVSISTLGYLFQNYSFYVPAYPSRSLCESVRTHCQGLYSFLWEDTDVQGESYIPLCNITSAEGLQLYPETEQTVREVRLRKVSSSPSFSPSSIQVNISSYPSLLTASQRVEQDKAASSWSTVCPHGFVSPEEPQHRRTSWIDGTGCAVACRRPVVTPEQYASMDSISRIAPTIGLSIIGVLLLTWKPAAPQIRSSSRSRKMFYRLAIITIILSGVNSVGFLLTSGLNHERAFCHNNAVPRSINEGVSSCSVQAVILFYTTMAMSLAWFFQCVDVFVRTILKVQTDRFYSFYLFIIVVFPLIAMIYVGSHGLLGYPGNTSWCIYLSARQTPKPVLNMLYIPGIIIGIIGTVCIACTLVKYLLSLRRVGRTARGGGIIANPGGGSSTVVPSSAGEEGNGKATFVESIKVMGPTILYNLGFCLLWVSLLVYPILFLIWGDEDTKQSYDSWVLCVFNHLLTYPSSEDVSWKETCGLTPYRSPYGGDSLSTTLHNLFVFCLSGQSIIVSLMFLPNRLSRWLCPNLSMIEQRRRAFENRVRSMAVRASMVMRAPAAGAKKMLVAPDDAPMVTGKKNQGGSEDGIKNQGVSEDRDNNPGRDQCEDSLLAQPAGGPRERVRPNLSSLPQLVASPGFRGHPPHPLAAAGSTDNGDGMMVPCGLPAGNDPPIAAAAAPIVEVVQRGVCITALNDEGEGKVGGVDTAVGGLRKVEAVQNKPGRSRGTVTE